MRIFNSDGSEAEMCGNGIRCFSKYCYENGVVKKTEFQVETLSGIKHVWLTLKGDEVVTVKVDMGAPNWERKSLPMARRRHMHKLRTLKLTRKSTTLLASQWATRTASYSLKT